MRLLGRQAECAALDRLLADAVAGRSGVVVLRGQAGVGKSALLAHAAERAEDAHLVRAVGVESEIELAYSGLHQLCAPMLDRLEALPAPQRTALRTVFGLSEGPPADRFMVGLATLTLFAEMAEQRPLVCIVDDAQWLDQASAQTIGFVARRLLAERIALVGAARRGVGDHVFTGLPEMEISGLGDSDARTLLLENVLGPLDAAVCEQIIKESHGNPLALLELPRTWKAVDLAGGFGLPDSRSVAGRIEESYAVRLAALPPDTQLLLLAAAAEPSGDSALLHRAAETLGLDLAVADPATAAGLLVGHRPAEFAHPLIRSAAYRRAGDEDRRRVHHALAEATNGQIDPDRRAWHRAQATVEPSEAVAAELERSAGRAQARGGVAATAAFLHLAVELTSDLDRRSARAIAAAQASVQAGDLDAALALVAAAEAGPLDAVQRASADLVRGRVAFAMSSKDAPSLLLQAGSRAETFDHDLAREISPPGSRRS